MGRPVIDYAPIRTLIFKKSYPSKIPWIWMCSANSTGCTSGDDSSWAAVGYAATKHYNQKHKEVSRAARPSI